jgi:hypothetical protein
MASRVGTTTEVESRYAASTRARGTRGEVRGAASAADGVIDPAFHRAILKVALELKKHDAAGYEVIVERTIKSMKLDPGAFRRYLGENGARNMSLLLATARTLGKAGS